MPHDLLLTNCQNLNNFVDEQNSGGLQYMVLHNNNRAEEMCLFKRKQNSF